MSSSGARSEFAKSTALAALDFGTRGQPETYAISPSGTVAAAKYSEMSTKDLELFLAAARQTG